MDTFRYTTVQNGTPFTSPRLASCLGAVQTKLLRAALDCKVASCIVQTGRGRTIPDAAPLCVNGVDDWLVIPRRR